MFLSIFAAEDRSPWGDWWFEPVTTRTASGMRIGTGTALQLSHVYRAVRILSETLAVLPFCLYRNRPDGGKDKVTDHWLYRLIARRPNRYQNGFEWRELMQSHLVLRGNAFNEIFANSRGDITELMPIHPDKIKIEMFNDGNYRYIVKNRDGTERGLARTEVWHIRGLSSDGLLGYSVLELARESFGLGLAAQDYGARFFRNDAKPGGGWIEFPGSFKDKTARDVFRESYQESQRGDNRGKIAVFENGMKFHEVGLTNTDAQFLESRKFQVTDAARWFGIPPHKLADLERSTNNNIEHQSLEFVNDTMTPWAERWEASIESELLLDSDEDLEVEFDFANLLRGDQAARAAYFKDRFNVGSITPNQIRIRENENPEPDPKADKLFVPVNMVPIDKAGEAPPQDQKNQFPQKNNRENAREEQLQLAASERVVGKEVTALRKMHVKAVTAYPRNATSYCADIDDFYEKHIAYVQEISLVNESVAQQWCDEQKKCLFDVPFEERVALLDSWLPNRARDLAALAMQGSHTVSTQIADAVHVLAGAITKQQPPIIKIDAPVTVSMPEREIKIQNDIHVSGAKAKTGTMERDKDGKMHFTVKEDK